MLGKYLDPKNDLAFKKIFGQEKHKRIPIAFLNAVFNLKGKNEIIDLKFLNVIQPPEIEARKESVVDVLVKDQKGMKYVIEMQVAKIKGFEKRAQFYAAKTYCTHFNVGGEYVDLTKVIFLAITSYVMFPDKKSYKSDHRILDDKTYENNLADFHFTFVELPKFNKSPLELETLEEKWYYFLKHAEESNDIDAALASSPEIQEAYEVLEKLHWTESELQQYDRAARAVADARGALAAAKDDGREEGLKEGKIAGKIEGKIEGNIEAKIEMAKNMILNGIDVDMIAKLTGLSEEEIKKIRLHTS